MRQNEFIHFRAPKELKQTTRTVAKNCGMRYSEWLRAVLELAAKGQLKIKNKEA